MNLMANFKLDYETMSGHPINNKKRVNRQLSLLSNSQMQLRVNLKSLLSINLYDRLIKRIYSSFQKYFLLKNAFDKKQDFVCSRRNDM